MKNDYIIDHPQLSKKERVNGTETPAEIFLIPLDFITFFSADYGGCFLVRLLES
ncbi:uncharacterized protein SPAPADRAFT_60454 [Spathaspora passalidarum NRRL Y-27907]|uniref:Uncharacterized protein n=1 Tax=Spathaspora passalidarum (strain NRRL Y-27907 / 11-Y1) TaxID=619300 RepID=G3ALA8_SPAPN|nr:uncharacterized protein SPAPADRAFT_60454 [Spathaspora passalidarum NRRL Y-27907]EGW33151.1 hypothetical protein SPAPADRAFT_60454 [Spathaspora passalidarum NRRL Y-27907]